MIGLVDLATGRLRQGRGELRVVEGRRRVPCSASTTMNSRAPPGNSLRYQKRLFWSNQCGAIRILKTRPSPAVGRGPRCCGAGVYQGSPDGGSKLSSSIVDRVPRPASGAFTGSSAQARRVRPYGRAGRIASATSIERRHGLNMAWLSERWSDPVMRRSSPSRPQYEPVRILMRLCSKRGGIAIFQIPDPDSRTADPIPRGALMK